MRNLSSNAGSDSPCEASGEDRDLTNAFTGKDEYQEIIKKAETYPLVKVFKKYNVNIDQFNRKSVCPFPFHKGGKESTASFYFYPETNTFWCFGCKSGRSSVDFVSKIENLNKIQAAIKITKNFGGDSDFVANFQSLQDDYLEKSKLHFEFSKLMRDSLSKSPQSLSELEQIFFAFDKMNSKYDLELSALKLLVERLTARIEQL